MVLAAEQARLAFILNVLLDEHERIAVGYPILAREAGRALCRERTSVPAISNGGYPPGQSIYQSVKGMTVAIERMHMVCASDAASALRMASTRFARSPRVAVIPDGVGVIISDPAKR